MWNTQHCKFANITTDPNPKLLSITLNFLRTRGVQYAYGLLTIL